MNPVLVGLLRLYDAFYKYDMKTEEQFDAMENASKILGQHKDFLAQCPEGSLAKKGKKK